MNRIFAAMLCAAALAFAQSEVTSVTGTVTDPTGAAVPGATVQVINLATSIKVNATTSENGSYTVPALPAGGYRVSVSKAGFKTETVENVTLIAGVAGTVNVKLEVGQASET